jgi:micrococcal nuclease
MTKNSILIPLIIAFLFAYPLLTGCNTYDQIKDFVHPDYVKCSVAKVIDGDAFDCQLSDVSIERVRLIGIGIPESIRDGATHFSKSYLRRGVPVRLEFDKEKMDSYGNILAYVYLPGGKMLNSLLIQEGYAQVIVRPPNIKYKDLFAKLEAEAREQNKGLWKSRL